MNLSRPSADTLLLGGILLAAFLVYFPGLFGEFILDDYINIASNPNAQMTALSWEEVRKVMGSGIASALSRPLSMLSFGLNHYFSGLDPVVFKFTNVLIHLLTALCVWLLTRELVRIGTGSWDKRHQLLALFVTACWALHPINASTVLYVVQRMTELSALVMFFTLYYYCRVRSAGLAHHRQTAVFLINLGLLCIIGVLCKENAALIPLLILTIEAILFRFRTDTASERLFLRSFAILFLALPAMLVVYVLLTQPVQILGDYNVRPFTMGERVLTQLRALWHYLRWLLLPDHNAFIFHHDNLPISRSLFEPVTTLLSLCGLLLLAALAWWQRLRLPLLSLGIAFFFAGHALESTIVSLELMFEHRNYLPGYGIMLALGQVLWAIPAQFLSSRTRGALALLFLLFLGQGTVMESLKWSNSFEQMLQAVEAAPDSHRANYSIAVFYLDTSDKVEDREESLRRARHYFLEAMKLDQSTLRAHLGYIYAQSGLDEPIDEALIREMEERLQNNRLTRESFLEVSRLTECWYRDQCKFPQSLLLRMYNAIARNEVSSPILVQGILDQVGTAMITIMNRPSDGKALLYLARNARPDVTVIDLKLIQLELQDGNFEAAEALLDAAKAKDAPSFAEPLQGLTERLQELRNGQAPATPQN